MSISILLNINVLLIYYVSLFYQEKSMLLLDFNLWSKCTFIVYLMTVFSAFCKSEGVSHIIYLYMCTLIGVYVEDQYTTQTVLKPSGWFYKRLASFKTGWPDLIHYVHPGSL